MNGSIRRALDPGIVAAYDALTEDQKLSVDIAVLVLVRKQPAIGAKSAFELLYCIGAFLRRNGWPTSAGERKHNGRFNNYPRCARYGR